MLSVVEARPEQQGGDPGPAGAGAVYDLCAARAAGLSEGEQSEELQRTGETTEERRETAPLGKHRLRLRGRTVVGAAVT